MSETEPLSPAGGQFLVYRTEDGKLKIDVRFEGETVWLTQPHMAALFQTTQQNNNSQGILVSSTGRSAFGPAARGFLQPGRHHFGRLPRQIPHRQGIYQIDMLTGVEGEVAKYPTPDELWAMTFAEANAWRDRFAAVPYEDKGGRTHPVTTRTSLLRKSCGPLPRGACASCSRWPPAPVKPSSPSRSRGNSFTPAGT